MTPKIPFTHNNLKGVLVKVSGAAAPTYHLYIDDFYNGQLVYSEDRKQWNFSSQTGKYKELEGYFVGLVTGEDAKKNSGIT